MVESSRSEGAKNGAHSLTLLNGMINKAIQTILRLTVKFNPIRQGKGTNFVLGRRTFRHSGPLVFNKVPTLIKKQTL